MDLEVVETPFGKFQINPRDGIGMTTKAGTLWDGPGFLQVIAREYGELGVPGVTILDVGANIGTYSVWLAREGAWRVIAVEPAPVTMQMLKANLDLNRAVTADRVIPIEAAGYSRTCDLSIADWQPDNLGATALRVQPETDPAVLAPIRAVPLDTYLWLYGSRVSLIKVDAQGCDGAVLLGLEETIRADHPTIVFEWEDRLAAPHGVTFAALTAWLGSLGYGVFPWPSQPDNFLARRTR